jgi:hypothetical protein
MPSVTLSEGDRKARALAVLCAVLHTYRGWLVPTFRDVHICRKKVTKSLQCFVPYILQKPRHRHHVLCRDNYRSLRLLCLSCAAPPKGRYAVQHQRADLWGMFTTSVCIKIFARSNARAGRVLLRRLPSWPVQISLLCHSIGARVMPTIILGFKAASECAWACMQAVYLASTRVLFKSSPTEATGSLQQKLHQLQQQQRNRNSSSAATEQQ